MMEVNQTIGLKQILCCSVCKKQFKVGEYWFKENGVDYCRKCWIEEARE